MKVDQDNFSMLMIFLTFSPVRLRRKIKRFSALKTVSGRVSEEDRGCYIEQRRYLRVHRGRTDVELRFDANTLCLDLVVTNLYKK